MKMAVASRSIGVLALLSASLASTAFAQTNTTFTVNPGSPQNGANGESIPPYEGIIKTYASPVDTVGGHVNLLPTSTLTTALAFCDDFSDNVYWGQEFAVLITDLSAFPAASPPVHSVYYQGGETSNATQTQEYIAAAILAVDIASDPTNAYKQDIYGFAIWDIFQPANTLNQLNGNPADKTAVQNAAASALAAAVGLTGSQYEFNSGYKVKIYTPTYNGTSPYGTSDPAPAGSPGTRPQEFITVTYVPEPATWAALGLDSLGAVIAGLYFRHRQSRGRS